MVRFRGVEMSEANPAIDLDRRDKRPQFFADPAMDTLMTALLETMSENWALKERLYALEKVLRDNGTIPADAVDAVRWTDAENAAHERERQRLLNDAFRALTGGFKTASEEG